MRPSRVIGLCLLVTVLGACDHPAQNAESPVLPASSPDTGGQPANPQAREQQPTKLSAEEVNTIRQEVERCGGELVCNREGQPVTVNLARARVSADDQAFEAVLQCSDLRELRLRAQQLSAKSLSRLPSLMNLEVLSLEAASVDHDTLNFSLNQLPHLRELSLRALPQLQSHTLVSVAGLPELTKLSLISLPLDERVVSAIAAAPGLKSLDLRLCTGFASSDLNVLTKAPQLTDLKLGGPIIDNKACQVAAALPHLEHLTIEDAQIDAEGIAYLVEKDALAQQLRSLTFTRCYGLDDTALQALSKFSELQTLVLRDVPVSGSFLSGLAHPEQLTRLGLSQTFLVDDTIEALPRFVNLKRLELAANPMSQRAMEAISKLSRLEYLDLSGCNLNDELIQPLRKIPHLKTAVLADNPAVNDHAQRAWLWPAP